MGLRIIGKQEQAKLLEVERAKLLQKEANRFSDIKGEDPEKTKEEFLDKINSIKARISIDSAKSKAEMVEEVLKESTNIRTQGRIEPSLIIDLL